MRGRREAKYDGGNRCADHPRATTKHQDPLVMLDMHDTYIGTLLFQLGQILAQLLHDQKVEIVLSSTVNIPDDVWTRLQLFQGDHLQLEHHLLVVQPLDLDRRLHVRARVQGRVRFAECTLPDLSFNLPPRFNDERIAEHIVAIVDVVVVDRLIRESRTRVLLVHG